MGIIWAGFAAIGLLIGYGAYREVTDQRAALDQPAVTHAAEGTPQPIVVDQVAAR